MMIPTSGRVLFIILPDSMLEIDKATQPMRIAALWHGH
jgi:hypothetical protein